MGDFVVYCEPDQLPVVLRDLRAQADEAEGYCWPRRASHQYRGMFAFFRWNAEREVRVKVDWKRIARGLLRLAFRRKEWPYLWPWLLDSVSKNMMQKQMVFVLCSTTKGFLVEPSEQSLATCQVSQNEQN